MAQSRGQQRGGRVGAWRHLWAQGASPVGAVCSLVERRSADAPAGPPRTCAHPRWRPCPRLLDLQVSRAKTWNPSLVFHSPDAEEGTPAGIATPSWPSWWHASPSLCWGESSGDVAALGGGMTAQGEGQGLVTLTHTHLGSRDGQGRGHQGEAATLRVPSARGCCRGPGICVS